MGTVYLATDQNLQRPVALKVPKFGRGNAAKLRERFFVEARAAAALRHTNLCPVYEVGEIEGQCFLAMAYIEGRPLSDFVSPDHPLPIDQVATIVTRLADGLAHAHARGVIHRDLKPSNVIIDSRREPILTDFGLARRADFTGDSRLTATGMILGSPAYMSPEQATGQHEQVGPRSDIYCLGAMFYEMLTGRRLRTLAGHDDSVTDLDFSPDGKTLVSCSDDHTVRIWDVATGVERKRLSGHSDSVNSVEFSRDGTRLVSGGGDMTVMLWDVKTGERQAVLQGHTDEIWSVCFRGDGAMVASGADDFTVRLWDVTFSPDGTRLASCSADGTIRIWTVPTRVLGKALRGHTAAVGPVAVSPDGRLLASGSIDQTLRLWDAVSGKPGRVLAGHSHWIYAVAFGNSNQVLYSVGDTTLRRWDTATGRQEQSLEVTSGQVRTMALLPGAREAVVGDNDGHVTTWNLSSGETRLTLKRHDGEVSEVAVSPDGTLIGSVGLDGAVFIHSASDGRLRHTLRGSDMPLQCVAFRADGQQVAAGSHASEVFLWSVADGHRQPDVAGAVADTIYRLTWSPDGRHLVTAHRDGSILVRRPGDSDLLRKISAHRGGVLSVGFHPKTGELISSGFDNTIRLWPFPTATP